MEVGRAQGGAARLNFDIEIGGKKRRLSIMPGESADQYRLELDGKPCAADVYFLQANVLSLLVEGKSYRILFDPRPDGAAVVLGEQRVTYEIDDPRSLRSRKNADADASGARPLIASMPGRVVRILVEEGQQVEALQGLIVVEAMKMQNELKAPRAGTISRIGVEVGATVQAGKVLMVIE